MEASRTVKLPASKVNIQILKCWYFSTKQILKTWFLLAFLARLKNEALSQALFKMFPLQKQVETNLQRLKWIFKASNADTFGKITVTPDFG